jgi:hypothetical protein
VARANGANALCAFDAKRHAYSSLSLPRRSRSVLEPKFNTDTRPRAVELAAVATHVHDEECSIEQEYDEHSQRHPAERLHAAEPNATAVALAVVVLKFS